MNSLKVATSEGTNLAPPPRPTASCPAVWLPEVAAHAMSEKRAMMPGFGLRAPRAVWVVIGLSVYLGGGALVLGLVLELLWWMSGTSESLFDGRSDNYFPALIMVWPWLAWLAFGVYHLLNEIDPKARRAAYERAVRRGARLQD